MGAKNVKKQSVTLELGEFGCGAVEEQTRKYGISSADFLRAAAVYYLADIDSGRAAVRVPSLSPSPEREGQVAVELELDASAWRALEEEAKRQRVRLERLVEHTVFYLLADLDAGRVTTRIFKSLEGGEASED